jgi:outer membrane protein assembly factor BamE
MFEPSLRSPWTVLVVAACAALGACSSIDSRTRNFVGALAPYKMEVVQGNFVSKEQVEALKPGMAREQVKDILGTPLLQDVFHADRWDYVFTLRRQGVEAQARKFTVFFKGDVMDRAEGDTMPSESEFVGLLAKARVAKSVPLLEASESSLKSFPAPVAALAVSSASAPVAAAAPTSYPPLEAAP